LGLLTEPRVFTVASVSDELAIILLSPDASLRLEPLGTKFKFWLERDGRSGLFKAARTGSGEDWAEVGASLVARGLGIPHAEIDLATCDGRPGVISWSVLTGADALVPGNEVLARVYKTYPYEDEVRHVPQHTVRRCLYVSEYLGLPPVWTPPPEVSRGVHLFVGYLMLDALIGNTDRHDQNWAWILRSEAPAPGEPQAYLAPTFDHGSSLGRNLTDAKRSNRLSCKDARFGVAAYAANARSCMYLEETDEKAALVRDAFARARSLRPKAGASWLARLNTLDLDALRLQFLRIPRSRASLVAIDFALRMIQETRMSLLQKKQQP